MKRHTVLISGAGVAGPTLAYWLARYGFRPTEARRQIPGRPARKRDFAIARLVDDQRRCKKLTGKY